MKTKLINAPDAGTLGVNRNGNITSAVGDGKFNPLARLKCPLCSASVNLEFYRDKRRSYHRCNTCNLIFVPPEFHVSNSVEKSEYDSHQNHSIDLVRIFHDQFQNRL